MTAQHIATPNLRAVSYSEPPHQHWEIEIEDSRGWHLLKINGQRQRCRTYRQAAKRIKLILRNKLYLQRWPA